MVKSLDESLMQHALNEAWKYQGLTFPNPAVGAVVSLEDGQIVGIGAHQKAGFPHAEVLALKNAYKYLSGDERIDLLHTSDELHTFLVHNHANLFHRLSLHVSLEPCHHYGKTPPCSRLIDTLGIKRIVIGSQDRSLKAHGGGEFLKKMGREVHFGCLEKACDELLTPFTCKESSLINPRNFNPARLTYCVIFSTSTWSFSPISTELFRSTFPLTHTLPSLMSSAALLRLWANPFSNR